MASGNELHQTFIWGAARSWNIRPVCSLQSRLASPEEHSDSTERMWAVMFLEAPKNVARFHAFTSEELDGIALLDFHHFVTFSQNSVKESRPIYAPMCLSSDRTLRNVISCGLLSDSVV
jgi:hypothetical protein